MRTRSRLTLSVAIATAVTAVVAICAAILGGGGSGSQTAQLSNGKAQEAPLVTESWLQGADAAVLRRTSAESTYPTSHSIQIRCRTVDEAGGTIWNSQCMLLAAPTALPAMLDEIDIKQCSLLAQAQIDQHGIATLPAPETDNCFVLATCKGYADARAKIAGSPEIVLRMHTDGLVPYRVFVHDLDGSPIERFTLEFYRSVGNTATSLSQYDVNDSTGVFTALIPSVLSPKAKLSIRVDAGITYAVAVLELGKLQIAERRVDIAMTKKLIGAHGFVFLPSGEPASGVSVAWSEQLSVDDVIGCLSDRAGEFLLAPPATSVKGIITARHDGYAPIVDDLNAMTLMPNGDIVLQLSAGRQLQGFISEAGLPVSGARVVAWQNNNRPQGLGAGGGWFTEGKTNAEGGYILAGCPPGGLVVGVDARTGIESKGAAQLAQIKEVWMDQPSHTLDIELFARLVVRGSLDLLQVNDALMYLQLLDQESQQLLSTTECDDGAGFELPAPVGQALTLRVWMNANAHLDIPVPASNRDVGLGLIKLPMQNFHE